MEGWCYSSLLESSGLYYKPQMPGTELQYLVVAQIDSGFALVLLFLAISLFFHLGKGVFIYLYIGSI